MYKHTLRCVRTTVVAVEKQLSIQYSESVSAALVIQHAMHMCIISVACLAHQYFPTLFHKWHNF
jgi:hypothetical protein